MLHCKQTPVRHLHSSFRDSTARRKGRLPSMIFFDFLLMIYDEKTDVLGVISKFLVVDYVMHLSPEHCQAACSQRLELLPTLWLTQLTSGPAGRVSNAVGRRNNPLLIAKLSIIAHWSFSSRDLQVGSLSLMPVHSEPRN